MSEFALENPTPTVNKAMTHSECVAEAAYHLSKRCKVVLPEFYSFNKELPDVIGFNRGMITDTEGNWKRREYSELIEVKVSRGDFLSDKKKSFRDRPHEGMGDLRYYFCPKGLIKPEEVPEGWGLIYLYPSGAVRKVKGSKVHHKDLMCEFHLLYYYARRANYAGVHKTVVDYRGYDK